jgi:hypothetical protein
MTTQTQQPTRRFSEQHENMANDIMLEFVSYYRRYNRAVAYTWWRWLMVKLRWAERLPKGGVYYDWSGNLCPVGMLIDPNTHSFIDRHRLNRRPFSAIAARWGAQLLMPKYRWLASDRNGRSLMIKLREIHDSTGLWDDNGLNQQGLRQVRLLSDQYGLDTERISEQAIAMSVRRLLKRTFWQGETFKYVSIAIIMLGSALILYLLDK